jgi:predicted DNA-binding protein (UPF0251 family)/predicted Fe-Mo cluster-binding NifX family protein
MKTGKKRNITLKPTCFSYGPLTQPPKETIHLRDDELEALYLADFKVLYHEDCAKSLGVSRPTFAKLIKQARKKMVEMLMYGKGIELIREPHSFTLVFPSDDRITVHPYFLVAKYFAFAKVEDGVIGSITYKENPIYKELFQSKKEIINDESAKGLAAGRIIPPLLEDANILIARTLGDGIRRNIEGMGISIELSATSDLDTVVEELIS